MPDNEEPKYITVGELIEALSAYPKDAPVLVSRDSEGNGFFPLAGVDPSYVPDESSILMGREIELQFEHEHEAVEFGYEPEELRKTIVLWP